MSIIISFSCGLCFYVLADALADYISAKAHEIEANAELLKLENIAKLKGEQHED